MKCKSHYADVEKYKAYRRKHNRKYYAKTQGKERRPWTQEEERLVLEHSITDALLSNIINRSVQSIQQKRYSLKNTLVEV